MLRETGDAAFPRPRADLRLCADTSCQPVHRRHAHAAPQGPPCLQTRFVAAVMSPHVTKYWLSASLISRMRSRFAVSTSRGGRRVFREFLRCEYSEENILFWLACEDLKKENNPEKIEEKARMIYEDYVSILSPREVSCDVA